jgi:hypothetical protein
MPRAGPVQEARGEGLEHERPEGARKGNERGVGEARKWLTLWGK